MIADVQAWLDAPSANFGWLIRNADERSIPGLRFHSREFPEPEERPQLLIDFTPLPLRILPQSGTFVSTQTFDIILLIGALESAITGQTILLDGADITASLGPCFDTAVGTLTAGGQTWRCPGQTGAFLGVGSHAFSVSLDLSDGTHITDTVLWEVLENTEP